MIKIFNYFLEIMLQHSLHLMVSIWARKPRDSALRLWWAFIWWTIWNNSEFLGLKVLGEHVVLWVQAWRAAKDKGHSTAIGGPSPMPPALILITMASEKWLPGFKPGLWTSVSPSEKTSDHNQCYKNFGRWPLVALDPLLRSQEINSLSPSRGKIKVPHPQAQAIFYCPRAIVEPDQKSSS